MMKQLIYKVHDECGLLQEAAAYLMPTVFTEERKAFALLFWKCCAIACPDLHTLSMHV